MRDCFTCEYAKRDKHNRFEGMCSGSGNCAYSEFEGEIKPTLEEYINKLNIHANGISEEFEEYKKGFKTALEFIKTWNDEE